VRRFAEQHDGPRRSGVAVGRLGSDLDRGVLRRINGCGELDLAATLRIRMERSGGDPVRIGGRVVGRDEPHFVVVADGKDPLAFEHAFRVLRLQGLPKGDSFGQLHDEEEVRLLTRIRQDEGGPPRCRWLLEHELEVLADDIDSLRIILELVRHARDVDVVLRVWDPT